VFALLSFFCSARAHDPKDESKTVIKDGLFFLFSLLPAFAAAVVACFVLCLID
jgi:hypothetical protein